jgi:hypothetical protein
MKPRIKIFLKDIGAVLLFLIFILFFTGLGVVLILAPFFIWDGDEIWFLIFLIIAFWMAGIPYAFMGSMWLWVPLVPLWMKIKNFFKHIKHGRVPPGDE